MFRILRDGCIVLAFSIVAASAESAPPASRDWLQLGELQRIERVIKFGCMKGLVNELVADAVQVTREYRADSFRFNVRYKRYENQYAWVDLDAGKPWGIQEDRRDRFTVKRSKMKRVSRFKELAFLDNADRLFVSSFFIKPAFASAMRSEGNIDVIPGEVAEVSFEFADNKLQSLTFDCNL